MDISYQILLHRFKYAEIIPYRDTSKIGVTKFERNKMLPGYKIDIPGIYEDTRIYHEKYLRSKDSLNGRQKNAFFFFSDKNMGDTLPFLPYFLNKPKYFTTKDRHIKKHFNRPFSGISIIICERSIYRKGDKIIVKVTHWSKSRNFNNKFFSKKSIVNGFSFNIKTGNFITFSTDNKNERSSTIRQNVFIHLMAVMNGSNIFVYNSKIDKYIPQFDLTNDKKKIKQEFNENFDDNEFILTLYKTLFDVNPQLFSNSYDETKINKDQIIPMIMKLFVHIKQIKAPDNYEYLITNWYPTKKYLKKNENKLIAAILDRLKIKSKLTVKLLHTFPNIEILGIYKLVAYFGYGDLSKYLSNINYDRICFDPNIERTTYPIQEIVPYTLNDFEKSNILQLLNSFREQSLSVSIVEKDRKLFYQKLQMLDDHFNMIYRLKEYYPEIQMNANNWKSFDDEHLHLSILQSKIKKGKITEYLFDEKLITHIENSINTSDGDFFPVILKTDSDYDEEGKRMKHCVGGYCNDEDSMIISLRHETKNSDERVTSQYNVRTKKELQSRYFCNGSPPSLFKTALRILNERVLTYPDTLKGKKIVTPITHINGKEIKQLQYEF